MSKKYLFLTLGILVALGVVGRLMPHAANTTPITAIALFISAYFGIRYSIPIIICLMLVSDFFIGFYSLSIMLSVYGSLIVAGLLGAFLQKGKTFNSTFTLTISSSLIFFLVTNWAVWQFGTMYEHSFSGLMQSYLMAIPFFKNSLVGDIFYSGLLFGVYELCSLLYRSRRRSLVSPIVLETQV